MLSNKIRQDPSIKGAKIFRNEIKVSQFAGDLFCVDLTSVENALRTDGEFGVLAGSKLNIKESKGITWLGKWEKNKFNPLKLKWLRTPVRILGIHPPIHLIPKWPPFYTFCCSFRENRQSFALKVRQ